MKKKLKKATTIALGVGLISSSLSTPYFAAPSKVHAATTTPNVLFNNFVQSSITDTKQGFASNEQLLNNLSPEQKEALVKLQSINQTGLHLAPEIDLNSTEEISVIVEFKQRPSKVAVLEAAIKGKIVSEAEEKKQVDNAHATFKKDLAKVFSEKGGKKGATYKVKRTFKTAFNGVSMKLPADQVEKLLQLEAVKAIYSDTEVKVEPPVQANDIAAEHMGIGMADERSHLQVDKLHAEGHTGKGIKIGVLDTGIDYNHPDLKAAFKGGYDFIDNDADPMETTYEDWKKSGRPEKTSNGTTYYTEHGTHVSGTIAGQGTNNSKYATKGIAPDADLYAYRVLGPYGSGPTTGIIAAIDKAVEDGMDLINMSLGAAINDSMDPLSIAVNNAVLHGVTAVVSAGNSGDRMYTLGRPGAAALALTVGASDVPMTALSSKGSLDTLSVDLRLLALGFGDDIKTLKGTTLPLVYAGMGATADFTGKDVKGKIALISRGKNIALADKIKTAKEKGAAAVLLFNDNAAEGHIPAYLAEGQTYIPTFSLSNADGLALKEKVEAGQINFTFGEMAEVKTQGDTLATFSSRGPSRSSYDIKPEVTAPGVAMLSTVPSDVVNGDKGDNYDYAYKRLSGTSMAAPVISGISALLLEANPKLQPSEIKTILMNTADPLSKPYSVFEQGAGRVDPYEAIHSNMEISINDKTPMIENGEATIINEDTGALGFGRLVYTGKDIKDTRSVTLSNNGKKDKIFDVKVQFQTGLRESKDAAQNGVKVLYSDSIIIKGNSSRKVPISLFIPKTAEKGTYEGYVIYTNKNNPSETYQVPFGVTYEENKFENFEIVSSRAFAPVSYSDVNPFINNAFIMNYQVKGHIKRIDFLYLDPETNKIVGHAGVVDGRSVIPNENKLVLNVGFYTPFKGDQNKPFSATPEYLASQFADASELTKHGNYKLRAIATDDQGNTFSADTYIFVDHSAPEFKITSLPHGVYEYEEGQKSVLVSGSIYENNIDAIKSYGFNMDQASNKVVFYYNKAVPQPTQYVNNSNYAPNGNVPLNSDGTFTANMPIDATIPILPVRFFGVGISSAVDYPKAHATYFVKKGTQYVDATPDKIHPTMGETVTYTLKMNNANALHDQTFTFDYLSDYFEIESITVHPELQKKASVQLEHKEVENNGASKKHTIHVAVDDPNGITGTTPIADVKVKIKNEQYYESVLELQNLTSYYTNIKKEEVSIPSVSVESYVNPAFSYVGIPALAEGVPYTSDYKKVGATGYATDIFNNKYDGNFALYNNGAGLYPRLFIQLPVTNKEFMYHMHVPGHFKYTRPFTVFKQVGNVIRGQNDIKGNSVMIAGDVNGDQVIDIMDAVYMQTYWGTNHREADINFDGTVDMNDFVFIEKNYTLQNPTLSNAPKPKAKYKNKTLETIKKELESIK
ncbi:S8 family serine peptidase [Ectobacillus sp. JY-23]|uniref:S8 family serine peptidase n=1 Tax=Ectobacillus sp. JY-23 TaxID=2933872 RepID=UPI001FF22BCC|nr:S8 family serine peptidase [Ectobacillus sp. JY-23]UOY91996.1 S8 family serine peptidase [Ectobacillus sp. JY-23]